MAIPATYVKVRLDKWLWASADVRVLALSEQRHGAAAAASLYEETAASALARQRAADRKAASAGFIPSPRKPGKKERRQIHRFKTGAKAIT